ncbi:MAG: cysteine protease [Brevundimonas sp.]|nr:MAG: cysteine protease [Brevundimonas sp.]
MRLPPIATALGGLLLSKGGRRMAGRHAGKLALATLALQLWQSLRASAAQPTPRPAQPTRARWSGRRP